MGEPTVLASLTDTLVKGAAGAGLPVPTLLAEAGLTDARFDDPEGRLPFRLHAALWEAVLERTADEPFGLRMTEGYVDAKTYGVVGYLSRSCQDVGSAMSIVVDYMRLINERAHAHVAVDDDGSLRFEFAPMTVSGATRHHTESLIAAFVVLARRWSGVPVRASEIRFQHPAPSSTAAHDELFGCPVLFGQPESGFTISAEVAKTPLTTADASLFVFLKRRADSLMVSLPSRSDLLKDVEGIIKETLAEGAPTVSFIARRLGLSARTLQRRLASEGMSYASLLDRYRREQSLHLLEDERLAIHDVSMMLGFSEPKAFRRAFKRWTGLSPRAHRNGRRLGQLSASV